MTDKEIIMSVEKSIRYISGHVRAHGREILKEYDISPLQFVALQWVNDKSGITIGQVANKLYLAHSTTTDIIDKLEQNNFVRRERSAEDKRLVLVKIEDKGLEIINRVIEKRVDFISKITNNLSENEKALLPVALEKLLHESESLFNE
ncbi:MarR family winged helix-turn-helix transcriptional regulator [Phocicoccus pinnipedialis]|uniref:Putative HTH-type transcriptional regulator YusO n=1 Tax=Phocicoccus pinnipedialis TaxID=110845 RepID=A0A6V7RD85_9BACL|nr:MarR family transcriptional regulator [Jeotgalicoccus pinnipedialis]MBP1939463.1 DNA-binding MarR family transcriptional regulator [Jeotgalicoccus pinnipedialis]CAD2075306.1 putative HTH-type transcriptional regulator YusO [Jeotgalicoccus pinnipedialis]